jgi:PAS domain S-box-containing protein
MTFPFGPMDGDDQRQHSSASQTWRSGTGNRVAQLRYMALLWLSGCALLALVTWVCFKIGFNEVATECVYLIIIVLLSLLDSFLTSVFLSLVAIACLDFFFIKPIFSLDMQLKEDLPGLVSFLISSLVITALVRHVRRIVRVRHEQAELLDLTFDTVIVRDMNGVIKYWNRGAEELYGWKRGEATGQVIHSFLHTRFPMALSEITDSLVRNGRWEGELVHTKRDGIEVVVSSRWALQRNHSGQPKATLETGNDISARKRAEEMLRQSHATYLAEAQKLSRTGSFGWNVSSGEVSWSEETLRIFGYDAGVHPTVELLFERMHPDDAARVRQAIDLAASTGQDFDLEHRLMMPDGTVSHLRVVAHATTDEAARLQFVGAIMDVTEAKQAEQKLHETQSELARVTRLTTLGELSASIAHEIGQPLAAIVTNGEACVRWLDHPAPQPDEVRACVTQMIAEGRRASEIVHHIRSLAKKNVRQKIPLQLNDVINDVVSLTQHEVLSHHVLLCLKLARGLPPLLGDRVQLQQVVLNLVMNGIQAMDGISDRPRALRIESHEDSEANVVVAVQDSGAGISPEHADLLFDAFFSTKPNGMGMGLSICRSIIEAHEGRMEASNNIQHGATFQCILPAITAGGT